MFVGRVTLTLCFKILKAIGFYNTTPSYVRNYCKIFSGLKGRQQKPNMLKGGTPRERTSFNF